MGGSVSSRSTLIAFHLEKASEPVPCLLAGLLLTLDPIHLFQNAGGHREQKLTKVAITRLTLGFHEMKLKVLEKGSSSGNWLPSPFFHLAFLVSLTVTLHLFTHLLTLLVHFFSSRCWLFQEFPPCSCELPGLSTVWPFSLSVSSSWLAPVSQ